MQLDSLSVGSQHTGAHCCADKCLPLSALDARDDGELGLAQSGSARHSTCFLVIRHVFGIRGSVCVVVVIIMAFFDGQKLKNNLKAQRHFAKHKATAAWSKVRLLLEEGTPLCTCVSDFRSRVLLLGADQGTIVAALREILSINGTPWPYADAVSHLPQLCSSLIIACGSVPVHQFPVCSSPSLCTLATRAL